MFQYFGDIFIIFSRKPLMSSTRCGIYYGLGRCWGPVKSSKMAAIWPPSWILPKINIYQKKGKLKIVNASHVKYDKIKPFAPFCLQFLPFSPKKGEKHSFTQKWLDHLLLMTSYLVTIATDSHQTCVKMCLRDMPTANENGRC